MRSLSQVDKEVVMSVNFHKSKKWVKLNRFHIITSQEWDNAHQELLPKTRRILEDWKTISAKLICSNKQFRTKLRVLYTSKGKN